MKVYYSVFFMSQKVFLAFHFLYLHLCNSFCSHFTNSLTLLRLCFLCSSSQSKFISEILEYAKTMLEVLNRLP